MLVEKRVRAYQVQRSSQMPLEEEVVVKANELIEGNPRRLLKLLGRAVDLAVLLGKRRVDMDVFDSILKVDAPKFDYVKKSTEKYKEELFILVEEFDGGPAELEAIAEVMEATPSEERTKLEAMVIAGLIEKDAAGRYYVPPDKFLKEKEEKAPPEPRWKLRFRRRKI